MREIVSTGLAQTTFTGIYRPAHSPELQVPVGLLLPVSVRHGAIGTLLARPAP